MPTVSRHVQDSQLVAPAYGSGPRHAPLSAIPCSTLRSAAQRVCEHLPADLLGGEPETVRELLAGIAIAISDTREDKQVPVPVSLRSVLSRRLLELLRGAVIDGWAATTATPDAKELLSFAQAFEAVRRALEPDWDQFFAQRLSSPDGAEIVVEVAHDLRSPLTSILFLAETLQRAHSGPVTEQQHRQLGLIYSAALGLSTLASNVIELARNAGQLRDDHPTAFSVSEIFHSVSDVVRPMTEEKGLGVKLLPPTSDYRTGYPQALGRVLLNLTTNAIKFTDQGFVEIVGRATSLTRVEFSVRDTGPGIREDALRTLYLPFRPAPQQDRFAFSGTGLGLALSRKLVELMGSELQVETRPDWGSRFYFELDLPLA